MSEELDYMSMRILPISMLLLLLIMPLLNISIMTASMVVSEIRMERITDLGSMDTVYFACEFLNLLATIVSLVCLYRMNGISKAYNYAWIIFVFELISEMVRQISGLFIREDRNGFFSHIIHSGLNLFPKLFIIAGVAVLLNGLTEMLNELRTDSNTESLGVSHIKNLNKFWVVVELIRNLIWFVLYASAHILMLEGTISLGKMPRVVSISVGVSVILMFVHVVISIIIFFNIWKVFKSYYLYRYNRGV